MKPLTKYHNIAVSAIRSDLFSVTITHTIGKCVMRTEEIFTVMTAKVFREHFKTKRQEHRPRKLAKMHG